MSDKYSDNEETISEIDDDEVEINDDEVEFDENEIDDIINLIDEEVNEEEVNDDDNDNNDKKDDKKKSTKADVWDYVDTITRRCPFCGKVFKDSTGTSSIRSHLKNHGVSFEKETQTTLDNYVKRHSSEIQAKKTQTVIEWIVLDMQPFKVVEGEAFHKMISILDPQYQIPGRGTVKNIILKQFEKRRELIKNFIKNIPGKVAITTDIWSSLKFEGFLGITIHFIDENWILKRFTLDIFRFKGSHTGQAIADEIYKVLVEFGLETKTIAITTDNGSNMVSGAKILKSTFTDTFIHYRCVAHVLNLIVIAGLEIVKENVKKLRKLIKIIRKSTKLLEELENLAKLDSKQFLRPIMDCKTRWNSTYKMINRACILKDNIEMLLVKHSNLKSFFPNENEWELFKDLDQFLCQFNEATIDLSSQKYPTIAHSRVVLLALKKDLEADYGEDYLLKDIAEAMSEKFNEYFERLEKPSHIAAFLDPRYKKYCFPEMTDREIQSPIRQKLEQQQQMGVPIISTKKVSSFLKRLKETTSVIETIDDEVHKYWISAEAEEDIKPLDWWKTHSTEYPNLSKLAVDYLCIQASSVPCEQLFSIAGQVLCKSRNRLSGDTVRACLCLYSWISQNIV